MKMVLDKLGALDQGDTRVPLRGLSLAKGSRLM